LTVPPVADRPSMPGYGIAATSEGLLPWSWAQTRLERAHRYWLATTGPDATPHLAAVWAVWFDGDLCFSTGGRSRKARNLAGQPRCAMGPEGAEESIVVHGVARRLSNAAFVQRLRTRYLAKYGEGFPDDAANPVFAVRPETVIAVVDRGAEFTTTATRWRFPPS
jgi:pyridoxamine 5'-phosphate oxidase-like protein